MEKEQKLTSPWIYAGLDYPKRIAILNRQKSNHSDLKKILEACSEVFDVDISDMTGPCRKQKFAMARHAFCKIARDRTSETYASIGRFLGGRDHATVVNSKRKATDLVDTFPWFRDRYEMCERLISTIKDKQDEELLVKASKRLKFITITPQECKQQQ